MAVGSSFKRTGAPKATCSPSWQHLPKVQAPSGVGFATIATRKSCISQLETVFRTNFANPKSHQRHSLSRPWGQAHPIWVPKNPFPPTFTCSKDDLAPTLVTSHRWQEKVAGSVDATRTWASLHLQSELLCKLLPSLKGSSCLPSLFHLFPRPCGQLGSTILWKRAHTIFPLSFKRHSHLGGTILWQGQPPFSLCVLTLEACGRGAVPYNLGDSLLSWGLKNLAIFYLRITY